MRRWTPLVQCRYLAVRQVVEVAEVEAELDHYLLVLVRKVWSQVVGHREQVLEHLQPMTYPISSRH